MRRLAPFLMAAALAAATGPVTIKGEGTLTLKGLNQPNTLQWTADGLYTLTMEDTRLTAQKIVSDGKSLHAEGEVQATYGKMNVTSDTLDYELSAHRLHLTGACTFEDETYTGSAGEVEYNTDTKDIVLTGDAHVMGEKLDVTAPVIDLKAGREFELPQGGHIIQDNQEVIAKRISGLLTEKDFTGTIEGPVTFKLDMGGQSVEVLADSAVKSTASGPILIVNPKVTLAGGTAIADQAEFDREKNAAHFTGHISGEYQQRKFSSDEARIAFANGHYTVTLAGHAQIILPSEKVVKKS
ncbi:MAG: LptA/OstA family protein [bacterium]